MILARVFEAQDEAFEIEVRVAGVVEFDPESWVACSGDFIDGQRESGWWSDRRSVVIGVDFDFIEPGIVHDGGDGIEAEIAGGDFSESAVGIEDLGDDWILIVDGG